MGIRLSARFRRYEAGPLVHAVRGHSPLFGRTCLDRRWGKTQQAGYSLNLEPYLLVGRREDPYRLMSRSEQRDPHVTWSAAGHDDS